MNYSNSQRAGVILYLAASLFGGYLVKVIWLLGNMITNIISYAIGFLLLIIGGCAIYCIVKAMWTSLAILIGMGMAVYLVLFLLVWSVVKAETIGNALGAFIRS